MRIDRRKKYGFVDMLKNARLQARIYGAQNGGASERLAVVVAREGLARFWDDAVIG